MITIATYTFYKITMAIIRTAKQRSMFASFGELTDMKAHTMNVLTGTAVYLFVLTLRLEMIIKGIKKKGK